MDKQQYLLLALQDLENFKVDKKLASELAQVRAKAALAEFKADDTKVQFTFDPDQVRNTLTSIVSESSELLRENIGEINSNLGWIRNAAMGFEFLSKFSSSDDQELLLLNSAICYHISGYQANAQCIIKLLEKELDLRIFAEDSIDSKLSKYFRQQIIVFIKRDIASLQENGLVIRTYIADIQNSIIDNINGGKSSIDSLFSLVAHSFFHSSLDNFVKFCLDGKQDDLDLSINELNKSYEYFRKISDIRYGLLTSELSLVLEWFEKRSTWQNIKAHANSLINNPLWKRYLRYLAFQKSIVEFWLSQLKAIEGGILTDDDSYVVQMPTSAGKTLIAELSILSALSSAENSKCLYIAPYRALVNEIEQNLSESIGSLGFRISNLLGGFEFDTFEDYLVKQSDVLITTPEKLDLFLRTHPEYFTNVSVIIIDEGHVIGEGISTPNDQNTHTPLLELQIQHGLGRGALLEFLITRLKIKLPTAKFIFLSAVMPDVNLADFTQWLSKIPKEALRIRPTDRPSRQIISTFEWKSAQNGQIEFMNFSRLPDGTLPFVPFFLKRRQYKTGELTPKTQKPTRISWPEQIKNKAQTTALLAIQYSISGPVLVFCAQPDEVKVVIKNIVRSIKYLEASDNLPIDDLHYIENPPLESYHLALSWLGETHPLTQALHYSVGLHYGPLPEIVRQSIEEDFKAKKIHILVSTNTLGQGVNLPIKTAIIYSLERRWGEGEENCESIRKRDFWNICGRAGRAGQETEGQIVFVAISDRDKEFVNQYRDESNIEPVNSVLYSLLLNLIENRISQEELYGYLDSHILAILSEEVVDTDDENAIRNFLGKSLVGFQALRYNTDLGPLVNAIKYVSHQIRNDVPDEALRKVFSSTGLSIRSCQAIELAVDIFLANFSQELLMAEKEKIIIGEKILNSSLSACNNLFETSLNTRFQYKGSITEFDFIRVWINGVAIEQLRNNWDPNDIDGFSEYLADQLIYKLPWGINGFLRILSYKLGISFEKLPITWQHLPSMIKNGVNNVYACWALNLGVPTRELAIQLANFYTPDKSTNMNILHFVKWLISLPNDFIITELSGSDFEKIRMISRLSNIIPDDSLLKFVKSESRIIHTFIQGIQYENRSEIASLINEGDELSLVPEPENRFDPFAMKILFMNKVVGYVQRDKAKIVSRELNSGKKLRATAKAVKPLTEKYLYPSIEITIKFN